MAKFPPNHLSLAADLDGNQIIERLAIHHGDMDPGSQSQRSYVSQPIRLALMNPPDLHGVTNRNVGNGDAGQLVNGSIG